MTQLVWSTKTKKIKNANEFRQNIGQLRRIFLYLLLNQPGKPEAVKTAKSHSIALPGRLKDETKLYKGGNDFLPFTKDEWVSAT